MNELEVGKFVTHGGLLDAVLKDLEAALSEDVGLGVIAGGG